MSAPARWVRASLAWATRRRVPLTVLVASLAVAAVLWLVSPATNKVYNFTLLTAAVAAALLSVTELVRGETHQRKAAKQLADVASLLTVQASLEAGFADQAEGQVLDEIEVAPDWTDRAGPAIKRRASRGIPTLYEEKEPASDLVVLSFRVSNVKGRDPATDVHLIVGLPKGWEAYANDEFEALPLVSSPSAERPWWGPIVKGWEDWEDRRRITFGATSITNGRWLTMEPVWIRMPPSFSGTFYVTYSLTAERVSPINDQLTINVHGGQPPPPG